MTTVGVFSARADGATTVAIGLAAVLAARARTLLIDLNLDNPEVATILDLDPEVGIFDLAYKAQLAPVDRDELEQHCGFRDRIAVVPGITRRDDVDRITAHFLSGLLDAASRRFEHVVIDLGRLPSSLATAASSAPAVGRHADAARYSSAGTALLGGRATRGGVAETASIVRQPPRRARLRRLRALRRRRVRAIDRGTLPDAPDYWTACRPAAFGRGTEHRRAHTTIRDTRSITDRRRSRRAEPIEALAESLTAARADRD